MKIWNHHPVTGELIGSGVADPNPVEAGEWIIPAHATAIAPGEPQPGRAHQFTGGSWISVPDHRGEVWWKADATDNSEPQRVAAIGDPTAFEPPLTNVEPPAPPVIVKLFATARQMRQALTLLDLRVAIEDWAHAAGQDVRDNWQFATEFVRGSSLIDAAMEDLGKTPEEVDLLFSLAKAL